MSVVYSCLVEQHDLRLVLLAVVICGFATFTAINLLGRARVSVKSYRYLWLATAAVALGCGIWSTHFVAMLAYAPGLPTGYDVLLTLASVVVAVVVTGLGLAVHLGWKRPWAGLLAGAIVGAGIGSMHFTGMSALRVPGWLSYDPVLFAAAWLFGIALSALAFHLVKDCKALRDRLYGANVLALAIAALHFTAMGAVIIVPDPTVAMEGAVLSPGWLAISIAGATFTVLLLAFVSAVFDQHLARRASDEAERLQDLANASVEGIVICRDQRIVDANRSFAAMAELGLEELIGKNVTAFIGRRSYEQLFQQKSDSLADSLEALLTRTSGACLPVELRLRTMKQRAGEHQVISVRDMRERKRAEARIQHLAHHDTLTDLANRALFSDRLEHDIARAHRAKEPLAVMCLDLDRFKEVNDVFGHPAGDALLTQAAKRLRETVRETDTVARLGGDEFAVVQVGMDQPDSASVLAHRLLAKLGKPYELEGGGLQSSVSIGIAIYPDDGTDADTLLRNADMALYRAKEEGRGTHRFFEAEMDERLRKQRMLEIDLRQALARDELRLVYQPQALANTGEIIGFEALLRWHHPREGAIPPAVFIPLAEQCGYIGPLGLWVLTEACREAASWSKPLRIAVNLSPVQFQHGNLAADIERTLASTGLSPERLELEITEGVLLKDKERALEILQRLKQLGVRVAMDDFGTGYSSLSSLQSFPFDKLKIDRSFVMSLTDKSEAQTIIRATIALGRGLSLPVVAEGVETDLQLAWLRGEQCDEIQGYLIGKPLPIDRYAALVGKQPHCRAAECDADGEQTAQPIAV
ncbi:MAG: EAL domain-containing protein [Kiloniellales bacterium]